MIWLADYLEEAAPTGEVDYRVYFAGVVAGSGGSRLGYTAAGVGAVGFVRLEREIDDERFTYDSFAGNEAPVAAVFAVVSVVTQNEVIAGRDYQLVVFNEEAHTDPPVGVNLGVSALETGEVVTEVIRRARTVDGIWLDESVTVDVDAAFTEAEAVAG